MKNYTRFAKHFTDYVICRKKGLVTDLGKDDKAFKENIRDGLLKCHIFEIGTDVKRLLALTKTPNKNDEFHLPFPYIFLDVDFKKEELKKLGIKIGYNELVGILVCRGELLSQSGHKVGSNLRMTILNVTREQIWFDVFFKNVNIDDEYSDYDFKIETVKTSDPNTRRFCHLFVLNFLNFINDPSVSTVTVEADERRNIKRLSKGKVPIPIRELIRLTGDLKKHVAELSKNKELWTYGFRFWVRGHFRTLRDPRYGTNVGKRMWLLPFTKGKGVLIEKRYSIGTDKLDEV